MKRKLIKAVVKQIRTLAYDDYNFTTTEETIHHTAGLQKCSRTSKKYAYNDIAVPYLPYV